MTKFLGKEEVVTVTAEVTDEVKKKIELVRNKKSIKNRKLIEEGIEAWLRGEIKI